MTDAATDQESSNPYHLDESQTTALEDLLEKQVLEGSWGYKGIENPDERDIAIRSEGMAEKLFARLYKSDPENARLKWQELTGKPADQGLMTRAQNTVFERDTSKLLPSLTREQASVQKGVENMREIKNQRTREEKISTLRGAMGDAEVRARDYGRRAEQGLVETDNEVSGLSLIKALWRGNRKVGDDYIASRTEKEKFKEMKKVMGEVRGGFEESAIRDARATVIGPRRIEGLTTEGAEVAQGSSRRSSSGNARQAADNVAKRNLATRISKMSGAAAARSFNAAAKAVQRMAENIGGRKQAQTGQQQIPLLPAPGTTTPGRHI